MSEDTQQLGTGEPGESVEYRAQLPELTPDIWRLVASHLSIRDLSSLSQACKQFHRAVVSEEVFEYFYLSRTSKVTPPASVGKSISWANLYRRTCAIRRQPSVLRNVPHFDSRARILAHVADTIVLYFEDEKKIRGYPGGWERDVKSVCTTPEELFASCIQVPDLGLGFLVSMFGGRYPADSECFSEFLTINAVTGEITHRVDIPVGQSGVTDASMESCVSYPKALLLAGRHGQYLGYFVDGGDVLRVVERLTGKEVRNFAVGDGAFGRLLRSACPETGGFTVTGVVHVDHACNSNGQRKCNIFLLDEEADAIHEFFIEEGEELIDVVRGDSPRIIAYRVTKDRKTLTVWRVEVTSTEDERHAGGALVERQKRWPMRVSHVDDGSLVLASEEFSMSANGRQIFLLPRGIHSKAEIDLDKRVFRATFDRDGTMSSVESVLSGAEIPSAGWSWTALCMDNRILIVCAQSAGLVSLFDLERGQRLWSEECSEPLSDMALVGEHYLVGVGENSGKIHAWHFDAYCTKPGNAPCDGRWAVGNCVPLFSEPEAAP